MTTAQARYQLLIGRKLVPLLTAAALRYGVPPAFAVAVASRETGLRNIVGDHGYGIGVMQIDIRYHAIARTAKASGSWKSTPGPLINYGVKYLARLYTLASVNWPQFGGETKEGWLKIAASSYNAGPDGANDGIRASGDSDRFTTGRDYGRDVLLRMELFAALLPD